jgi:hypothetical protein
MSTLSSNNNDDNNDNDGLQPHIVVGNNNNNDTIDDIVGQSASSDVVTEKQQLLLGNQLMQTKTQKDNHTQVSETQTEIFTYSFPTLILMPHFQTLKSGFGLY